MLAKITNKDRIINKLLNKMKYRKLYFYFTHGEWHKMRNKLKRASISMGWIGLELNPDDSITRAHVSLISNIKY